MIGPLMIFAIWLHELRPCIRSFSGSRAAGGEGCSRGELVGEPCRTNEASGLPEFVPRCPASTKAGDSPASISGLAASALRALAFNMLKSSE